MQIEIPGSTDTNTYPFKMLMKNKISGVLSCRERMEDGKAYLYVDIEGKRNLLQEYQDKEWQLEDMVTFFQEITYILEEIRSYLLHENMVVLDPEYIFRDLENNNLYILILPWLSEEKFLHKLAEYFLEKVNHKDENGVNAAYLFYRHQNQSNFSLYQFISILEKESILKRQKTKNVVHNRITKTDSNEEPQIVQKEPLFFQVEEETDSKKEKKEIKKLALILAIIFVIIGVLPMTPILLKISGMALALLFTVIFLLSSLNKKPHIEKEEINPVVETVIKETVFFASDENEDYLKLQWKEKGRKKQFVLKEFPCTIGKLKEEVSLVIRDNSVSRVHCRILERDGKICIMDLNSTNGTCLNGLPIMNGEIQEIEKNDEILVGKVTVSVV